MMNSQLLRLIVVVLKGMIYPNTSNRERHVYLVNGLIPCKITEMIKVMDRLRNGVICVTLMELGKKYVSNFPGNFCVWLHILLMQY